jgi:hypothetical protein
MSSLSRIWYDRKRNREQQLVLQRADRHAAGAVVVGVDVVFALRIVKLLRARADDDVVVGELAEIDARLGDVDVDRVTGGRSRTNSTGSLRS